MEPTGSYFQWHVEITNVLCPTGLPARCASDSATAAETVLANGLTAAHRDIFASARARHTKPVVTLALLFDSTINGLVSCAYANTCLGSA